MVWMVYQVMAIWTDQMTYKWYYTKEIKLVTYIPDAKSLNVTCTWRELGKGAPL